MMYWAKRQKNLFPDAVLLTLLTPAIAPLNGDRRKVINIAWKVEPAGTLRAALDLFPKTRRVVVVCGANEDALPFLDVARKAFAPWKDKLDFEYTQEMTYEQMLLRISKLPPDAIVICSSYFTDTTGRSFAPIEVITKVSQISTVPVFGVLDVFLGRGIVGGLLLKTEAIGIQAGKTALDYLSGRLKLVEPVTTFHTPSRMMFDWDELIRWKADVSERPEDSIVINRPLTLWGQYKAEVVGVTVAFATLIVLAGVLLIMNRRLKSMQVAASQSENRFRVLVENLPVRVFIKDRNSVYVNCNPGYAKDVRIDVEEIQGKTDFDFYPDELAEKYRLDDQRVMDSRRGEELEENYIRDGQQRWAHTLKTPLADEVGHVTGILGVYWDITDRKEMEESIEERTRFSEILIENSAVATFVLGPDHRVLFWNKACENLTGVSAIHMVGTDDHWKPFYEDKRPCLADLVIDGSSDKMVQLYQIGWTSTLVPEGLHAEGWYRNLGGKDRYIVFDASPIRNNKGELVAAIEILQDISEGRLAEDAFRKSQEEQRSIIETAMDGFLMTNLEGRILGANATYSKMSGYSKQELLTMGISDLEAQETVEEIASHIRKIRQLGQDRFESKHCRKDGSVFAVEISVQLRLDDGGRLIVFISDISLRKESESERERLMSAIEQAGEAIIITDSRGTIQFVNPAFEQTTGYSRDEAVGKTSRIIKSGNHDEQFYRNLWDTISDGRIWEGRMVNKRKDGTLYTEESTISPVRDAAGRIVNYVAVKRDITEQLQLSAQLQQAQRLESVGRLAGGVAHDFNNMLGVILGHAELAMMQCNPSEKVHGHLKVIQDSAHRSADLTRQLLAFARKQTVAPKVLDLNDSVSGMLKILMRLIGEDIHIAWLPGRNLWPVKMDPSQIDQILANLCVNARDAIEGVGKVTIETKDIAFDEEYCAMHQGFIQGDYVMLAVSDDGCGIDQDSIGHLFEPFFTTKAVGKGTGLGLATVYGIVKQNEGFINVYSEPGKGSTFKIYLPRFAEEAVESIGPRTTGVAKGNGETILLAEDEAAILNMTRTMLEDLGYTVLTASTPGEALHQAVIHAGKIQLLITDVVMPEMSGRDLEKQTGDITSGLKCLFMSGYTADVIAHHGVLEKGVKFIQKPFSMQELAAKVREALHA